METLTDSEYEFHKFKENVEKLMVCINKNDEALKQKYCGYPKDSALQYTHTDYYSKVAWKVKFAIISDSNIETQWETIKNMYCLLLNGKREYCFLILQILKVKQSVVFQIIFTSYLKI